MATMSVVRSVKRVERSAGRWHPDGDEAVGLRVAGSASLDRLGLWVGLLAAQ